MALDHYVSQVHLKRFYSPALGELMYAIRKSDMKEFTPDAKSVCRIDEGNTNDYLAEPRAIEEFLKTIESSYNRAVAAFEAGSPTREAVYVAAGFTSYVLSCSPAAMRLATGPLKNVVEMTAKLLDKKGFIPAPPPELGGKDLSELLESGKIKIGIDPKYPQAIGIGGILERLDAYGNFRWEILLNPHEDCPFFTSDFPVALEAASHSTPPNRIVPLTPSLAVRLHPPRGHPRRFMNFEFTNFSYELRRIGRRETVDVNRLLVRSAESLVFYRSNYSWVAKFVEKNRHFRIDVENTQLEHAGKALVHAQQAIKPYRPPEVV